MPWHLTESLDEFTAAADDWLRADPVRRTVPLTVLESLRQRGPSVYGEDPPIFGWHERAPGAVDGAFLRTPPFPLLVAGLPAESAGALLELLRARGAAQTAANLPEPDAAGFAGIGNCPVPCWPGPGG